MKEINTERSAGLFRQTAIDTATGSQIGGVFEQRWAGIYLFSALAMLVVGGLLLGAARYEYARVERVAGVVDTVGSVRLRAPIDGILSEVLVREGQAVSKNQPLAIIRLNASSEGMGNSQHQLTMRFQREAELAGAEISALQREIRNSTASAEAKLAGLARELTRLQEDERAATKLLASLKHQQEQTAQLVTQGFLAETQASKDADKTSQQESLVAQAAAAVTRVERDMVVTRRDCDTNIARLEGQIESRRRERSAVERNIISTTDLYERVISSPIDGVVSLSGISAGQSMVANQSLFAVDAVGSRFVIRMAIPSRAVPFLHVDDTLATQFDAYPAEHFGRVMATVREVSLSTVAPTSDLALPVASNAVYLATAELPEHMETNKRHSLQLRSGMTCQMLVAVERRMLLEWLFLPLDRGMDSITAASQRP